MIPAPVIWGPEWTLSSPRTQAAADLFEQGELVGWVELGNASGEQNLTAKYQAVTKAVMEAADFFGVSGFEHVMIARCFRLRHSRPVGSSRSHAA